MSKEQDYITLNAEQWDRLSGAVCEFMAMDMDDASLDFDGLLIKIHKNGKVELSCDYSGRVYDSLDL